MLSWSQDGTSSQADNALERICSQPGTALGREGEHRDSANVTTGKMGCVCKMSTTWSNAFPSWLRCLSNTLHDIFTISYHGTFLRTKTSFHSAAIHSYYHCAMKRMKAPLGSHPIDVVLLWLVIVVHVPQNYLLLRIMTRLKKGLLVRE
jgi:hypothetical protein